MNNWNLIINISIGAAGLILSHMGLFMSSLSRFFEVHTRRHLSGMFAVLAMYSATTILSYYDECVASVLERADHNMYENKKALKATQ